MCLFYRKKAINILFIFDQNSAVCLISFGSILDGKSKDYSGKKETKKIFIKKLLIKSYSI